MCHLILFMPLIALPIFWFMPPNLAIPIYAVIVVISGLTYRVIRKSMKERPKTGAESLIGAEAEVISRLKPGDHAQYLVRSQGELWSARSPNVLHPGETVNIGAVDGITLIVKRIRPYQKRASVAGIN